MHVNENLVFVTCELIRISFVVHFEQARFPTCISKKNCTVIFCICCDHWGCCWALEY